SDWSAMAQVSPEKGCAPSSSERCNSGAEVLTLQGLKCDRVHGQNSRLTYVYCRYIYIEHKVMDMSSGEREFLEHYDPKDFDRPSVTVDLVLMSVLENGLHALVMRREQHPAKGK